MQGIEAADTHHAANSFVYGPDGGMYWQRGVFIVENVETRHDVGVALARRAQYITLTEQCSKTCAQF